MVDYFKNFTLSKGAHETAEAGTCFMEAAALLMGEKHSDMPACVDPLISKFGQALNDNMSDEVRNELLKPYVVRVIGTRGSKVHEEARLWLLCDFAVRRFAPVALLNAGLSEEAEKLRLLAPVADAYSAHSAAEAARSAAYSAAAEAARSAEAVYSAAAEAAHSAAYSAHSAVYSAAAEAARSAEAVYSAAAEAAHSAAYSAAYSAAAEAAVWSDALELLDALIAVKPGSFDCEADECVRMLEKFMHDSNGFGAACGTLR